MVSLEPQLETMSFMFCVCYFNTWHLYYKPISRGRTIEKSFCALNYNPQKKELNSWILFLKTNWISTKKVKPDANQSFLLPTIEFVLFAQTALWSASTFLHSNEGWESDLTSQGLRGRICTFCTNTETQRRTDRETERQTQARRKTCGQVVRQPVSANKLVLKVQQTRI